MACSVRSLRRRVAARRYRPRVEWSVGDQRHRRVLPLLPHFPLLPTSLAPAETPEYRPNEVSCSRFVHIFEHAGNRNEERLLLYMVPSAGIEPATPGLGNRCSIP